MCRYFLNGNCRYGDYCRNSHVIQQQQQQQQETIAPSESIANMNQQKDTNNNNNTSNSSYTEVSEATRSWIDAPEFIPRFASQHTDATSQSNYEEQEQQEEEGASR